MFIERLFVSVKVQFFYFIGIAGGALFLAHRHGRQEWDT